MAESLQVRTSTAGPAHGSAACDVRPGPLRPAAGRRTRITMPSMIPVSWFPPRWSAASASVRSRKTGAMVEPHWASSGRTSPIAREMVERFRPISRPARRG